MPTITRSATLTTNEIFILPPGAKLLGATDVDAFTNSCITPTLETLACYVAIFGTATTAQQGADTIYWGLDNARIVGFYLNNIRTNFVGDYRNSGPVLNFPQSVWDDMGAELKQLLSSVIFTDGSFILSNGNDNGTGNYFLIQTIPSVANNLEMIYSTGAPSDNSNLNLEYRVPFKTYDSMVSDGFNGMPTCPSPDPEV